LKRQRVRERVRKWHAVKMQAKSKAQGRKRKIALALVRSK